MTEEVPPPGLRVTDDNIVRVIDLVHGQGHGAKTPIYGMLCLKPFYFFYSLFKGKSLITV